MSNSDSTDKTLEDLCDLNKYLVRLNTTLFGIIVDNISHILPKTSNVMKYSIYSEEIDSLQRNVACKMVTVVTEKVNALSFLCPNCSEYLNRKQNLKIVVL